MDRNFTLPIANGVTLETSADGKQTALIFRIAQEPGMLGVAVNSLELSRIASLLISQAAKVAAKVAPKTPPEKLTATPILASHLAFGKGRSDSEAIVSFRVGNLDLTFAVDVPILHQQCTRLLSMTKTVARRKPQ